MHEKVENTTSESDETDSSDDGDSTRVEPPKKKKTEAVTHNNVPHINSGKIMPTVKKKRLPAPPRQPKPLPQAVVCLSLQKQTNNLLNSISQPVQIPTTGSTILSDGHMTPEEVERHLQSQSFLELVPERAPPTVPTEMFSNEPSLDR